MSDQLQTTQPTDTPARYGSGDHLIELAIQSDIDVDKLERLIQMRDREMLRQAQDRFDTAFAEMQRHYVPAHKDGAATDASGTVLYKYAPLETILKVYAPIWTAHGFSWTWVEKSVTITYGGQDHRGLQITCVVTGHGYEKRYPVEVEIPTPTKFTNAVQVTGVAKTYGRRYSLIDAFSPIIQDEDDDARSITPDEALEYAEQIRELRGCTTVEDLKATGKRLHEQMQAAGDTAGADAILVEFKRAKAPVLIVLVGAHG